MKTRTAITIASCLFIAAVFTAQTTVSPQYMVIEADGTQLLEESVGAHMKKGWKPQGGVCAVFQGAGTMPRTRYFQSMVK